MFGVLSMILHNKGENDFEIVTSNSRFLTSHTHAFLEIAYVASGSAKHKIGEYDTVMKRGNYYIIDFETEHSYSSISDEPLRIINICFHPKIIDKSLSHCRSFNELLRSYLIKIDTNRIKIEPNNSLFSDDDGKIYQCIEALMDEYTKKDTGYIEIMRSQLVSLIIKTMRKLSASSYDEENLLSKIYKEVEKSPLCPPSLSAIAQKLGYSPYYLSSKFKELTGGTGYREYILKIRMAEASRLLANTNNKISEIAEKLGYLDVNSFYITFRKEFGMSPTVYRKSLFER